MFSVLDTARALARRMIRPAFFAATTSVLLGVAGCGADGGGPTGPSGGKVTGTYVLEYVDEEELPVSVHHGPWLDPATGIFYNNFVVRVTGGYIELRENESFYLALHVQLEGDGQTGQTVMEFEGEWDLVKDQVMLRVQFPIFGNQVLERDGSWLTTDIDFLGLGDSSKLEFKR